MSIIVIASHATFINGKIYEAPATTVLEILKKLGEEFIFIRHSIDGNLRSTVYEYTSNLKIKKQNLVVVSKVSILRYLSEIISTIIYFIAKNKKDYIYIGLDPLNALTGVLLKKLGYFKKVIYYTADYSPKRFESKILNKIYLSIDGYCVRNSDAVWNVSNRICKVRETMGLEDAKNIFVPNIPSQDYRGHSKSIRHKFTLVSLGVVGDQLDYIGIFEAVSLLKSKYPKLVIKIIGNGPKEDGYKEYVKQKDLQKHVQFLGYLEHPKALEEISKSGVGLALYNGNWNFNYYGDSMKCREFFCYGLPVITTDTHSTVEEIVEHNAGVVCDQSPKSYVKALDTIFQNYDEYSKRSYEIAKKHENIHFELITNL